MIYLFYVVLNNLEGSYSFIYILSLFLATFITTFITLLSTYQYFWYNSVQKS